MNKRCRVLIKKKSSLCEFGSFALFLVFDWTMTWSYQKATFPVAILYQTNIFLGLGICLTTIFLFPSVFKPPHYSQIYSNQNYFPFSPSSSHYFGVVSHSKWLVSEFIIVLVMRLNCRLAQNGLLLVVVIGKELWYINLFVCS